MLERVGERVGLWRGVLDYHLRPHLRKSWGGPFNGQHFRQRIARELFERVRFQAVVETGAYRGTTTEFLARTSGLPLYSVEIDPRSFSFAQRRLRRYPGADVRRGDSRTFLMNLACDESVARTNLFFYLDAHWGHDSPLQEEVAMILGCWRRSIIMIDDFQVPDDDGYEYDVLDDGTKLCLDHLEPLSRFGMIAFPAAPATSETGARRGCVVLATPDSAARSLAAVSSLKPHATVPHPTG